MNIPNLTKEYHTREGHKVVLSGFTPKNSCGKTVTFPLKGTVYYKDRPRKKSYNIWTLEGASSVFGEHPFDIVDMPPILTSPPPPCAGTSLTPPQN